MKTKALFSALAATLAAANLYAADTAQSQPSPLGSFLPLIVIFVIFYFFLIRPQQKRAKEQQKMLNAIKKDDRVLTSGGIYGTIASVNGDVLEVKIAENVKVKMARSAIGSVLPPENQPVIPEVVKK